MKICVGLSGGVDSSVAALLLKRQGYDVFAMFMQNWHDADATLHGDCEWEEDRFVAELVARKIGIPFYFIDLSKEYRQRVVDYMFNEYSAGRTPNPDVLCNREIKFDAFLKAAQKLGADMVATGHYCRRAPLMDAEGKQVVIDGLPQWRILEGVDPNKDQSYFLCQLTQEQLGKALFPIGNLTKPEVREIAREADLPTRRIPKEYASSARLTFLHSSSRNSSPRRGTWWRFMMPTTLKMSSIASSTTPSPHCWRLPASR